MKRKITYIAFLAIFLVFTALSFTACDDLFAGNEGTVTINFGGGGRSATSMPTWPGDDPETIALLDFKITLTGSGRTITREADGASGAIRIPSVPVGRWNVEVKAYYQDALYATSLPAYVDVKAGQPNTVQVQMKPAYDDTVYHTVTFNSNGGSEVDPIINVPHGEMITEPATPTKTGYECKFDGWYEDDDFEIEWDFENAVTGNITLYAKWRPYEIGEEGPGGGIVFYRDEFGFPCVTADGKHIETTHYLEAWTADTNSMGVAWALSGTSAQTTSIGTLQDIGAGRRNTALILAADTKNDGNTDVPAAFATTGARGNASDWFLPSANELVLLRDNLHLEGLGAFINDQVYWSSTESDSLSGTRLGFLAGLNPGTEWKSTNARVRPIRAFGVSKTETATYTVTFESNETTTTGSMPSPVTVVYGTTISKPADPTTTEGGATLNRFRGWYKDNYIFADPWDFASDTVTRNITLYADWGYRIGDTGPGDGKIFYRDETGFSMTDDNSTAYYLEVAPADTNETQWGTEWENLPEGAIISGVTNFNSDSHADASKIGNGRNDTTLIVAYMTGKGISGTATQLATSASFGNQNDWFLPSLGELKLLFAQKEIIDIVPTSGAYWSSSQDDGYSWALSFSNGDAPSNRYRSNQYQVRAIRAF